MTDFEDEQSPLLGSEPERDAPVTATSGTKALTVETTPLLADGSNGPSLRYNDSPRSNDAASHITQASGSDRASIHFNKKPGKRWPSIVAILVLALAALSTVVLAYFVPAAVEEYAKQGVVIEPTNLSLESITTDGVRARIQANFRLDGSRVKNEQVRRIGQTATWIVRKLGTEQTIVSVYLPEFSNVLLGSAQIPPLIIDLVDGHTTTIDFVADLVPGDAEGIRSIANQWLDGRLGSVRLRGKADIALKTGFIPLGTHTVSESLVFEAKELPGLPKYDIDRIIFQETSVPGKSNRAMGAELSISAYNEFPVQVDIPPLAFEVFVPNCNALDPVIQVADAITAPVALRPQSTVNIDVNGTVQELPDSLTALCPDSQSSPLDLFLKQYLNGDEAVVFVRGKRQSLDSTPGWISDILTSITVPIPFPGRTFDNLIRDFSLTDVKFTLPDPLAEPGEPESSPTVSGTILVTAGLPSQMNFAINVTSVRANADVFYHDNKLGELNLHKWQAANSTMTRATPDHEATLEIQSSIDNAPLNVTDGDVLTEVIQKLLFGGDHVDLEIKALVDIRIDTILGQLELKDVPAEGKIPVKPTFWMASDSRLVALFLANVSRGFSLPAIASGSLSGLTPQIGNIEILHSTPTSITLEALVNITNPTEYAAHVPFISVHILCNDTLVGTASAEDLDVMAGNNTNLVVGATWDPSLGGERGLEIGRNLLSRFVSGFNISLTVRAYRESIPSQPILGDALSKFNFTVQAPRLSLPGSGDDDGTGDGDEKGSAAKHSFIRDATFHIFSSTASFILASPLVKNTLYIESINATAYYNHTEPVGTIVSEAVFGAPPGLSETPKLPVDWSPDSVGFDKLRQALGGVLKLDAKAEVGVKIGQWRQNIWYEGAGIGAHVRP